MKSSSLQSVGVVLAVIVVSVIALVFAYAQVAQAPTKSIGQAIAPEALPVLLTPSVSQAKPSQDVQVTSTSKLITASSTSYAWTIAIPKGLVLSSEDNSSMLRTLKDANGLEGVDVSLYAVGQTEGPPPFDLFISQQSNTSTWMDSYRERVNTEWSGSESLKTQVVDGVSYISFPDQCMAGCEVAATLKDGFSIEAQLYGSGDEKTFVSLVKSFHVK